MEISPKLILILLAFNTISLNCAQPALTEEQIKYNRERPSIENEDLRRQRARIEKYVLAAEPEAIEILNKLRTIAQLQHFLVLKAQMKKDINLDDEIDKRNNQKLTLFGLDFDISIYEKVMTEIENTDIDDSNPQDYEAEPGEYTYYKIAEKLWNQYLAQIQKLFDTKIVTALKHQKTLDEIISFKNHLKYKLKYLPILKKVSNEKK